MHDKDRAAFANSMRQTAMTLGTDKLEEELLRRYWAVLKDYPINLVQDALAMAEKTESFWPKPATIIKLIGFAQEERSREQPEDKILEWERDRRLHPEEYYTEAEIPGVMAEIRKTLGLDIDLSKPRKTENRRATT